MKLVKESRSTDLLYTLSLICVLIIILIITNDITAKTTKLPLQYYYLISIVNLLPFSEGFRISERIASSLKGEENH